MSTVLTARARHSGIPLGSDTVATLRQPWMGTAFGRAIAAEPDAAQLWGYLARFTAARRAYLAAIDAPAPWPKSAKLGDAPPPGEAEEVRHDPRSPEERAASALRAWDDIIEAVWPISPLAIRYMLQAAEHDDPLAIPDAVRVLRGLGERMGW